MFNLLKYIKKDSTLKVQDTCEIKKISIPNEGTFKLPEPLVFTVGTSEQEMCLETMRYLCKTFLEKEK